MKNTFSIALIMASLSVGIFLQGCSSGNSNNSGESTDSTSTDTEAPATAEQKEVPAISLWDGISVRQEPSKQGKWLSSITLGETVTFLGQTAIDSTDKDRKYLKVVLSDGTEGWSVEYGLAVDAKLAATRADAAIYKRPDMLTVTKTIIDPMSMVAVEEENGEFVKVVGKERKKKGWILKSKLVFDSEEVAVAVLAEKQLKKVGNSYDPKALETFLENVPFKSTDFYNDLMIKLNTSSMATDEAMEDMEEENIEGDSAIEE